MVPAKMIFSTLLAASLRIALMDQTAIRLHHLLSALGKLRVPLRRILVPMMEPMRI
jgi:hypothetical protein